MTNNEQMIRELQETDPDELVELLRLTSKQLVKAFPEQVKEYLEELKEAELEMEDEYVETEPVRGRLTDNFFGDDDDDDDDGGTPW